MGALLPTWKAQSPPARSLGLEVNEKKTVICDVRLGVGFLGAYLKPRRRYVHNVSLRRMEAKVRLLHKKNTPEQLRSSINSFLGILSHYRSYRIRRRMFYHLDYVYRYGYYLRWMRKYVLYARHQFIANTSQMLL